MMLERERFVSRSRVRAAALSALLIYAIAAIGASSAFATHGELFQTAPRAWYTGSPGAKLTGTRVLNMTSVGHILINTSVAGVPIQYSAEGVECKSCKIENKEGTGAIFSGQIVFTGARMESPANCSIPSTFTTKPLTGQLGGSTVNSWTDVALIHPTEGATWYNLQVTGSSCAVSGTYKKTGNIFAEATNALGVSGKSQQFDMSQGIQEAYEGNPGKGGYGGWKFGENEAFLTGEIKLTLAPEEEFQVREK